MLINTHKYCMSINVIAEIITLETCKEFLFLNALSGSDYTSSFFPAGKIKFWNSWLVNQEVPETFIRLGNCASLPLRKEDINVIENVFYNMMIGIFFQLVLLGMRSSSPVRDALIQHIHKSAYVSGHIWCKANLPNKTNESPSN